MLEDSIRDYDGEAEADAEAVTNCDEEPVGSGFVDFEPKMFQKPGKDHVDNQKFAW